MIPSPSIKIALFGNPNAGKTSLLNTLSNSSLHVGNWPGKTVLKKEAVINYQGKNIKIIDLPGIYSLNPYSEEEKISYNFIVKEDLDLIIQVIDVNIFFKSLFLFFEILTLNKKTIIILNFNKEAEKKGLKINIPEIEKILKVKIIKFEANRKRGINTLLEEIVKNTKNNYSQPKYLNTLLNSQNKISHKKSLDFIQNNLNKFYFYKNKKTISEKIDNFVFNKFTAWPIFFLSIYFLFETTFLITSPIIFSIRFFLLHINFLLDKMSLPPFLFSFLSQGVLGGLGSILNFIPLIFVLFFLLSLMEDSGYFARIIVLLDRPFSYLRVSGQSFIPMVLGFGCNVPAILATRTIKNKKERLIAIFVNPFISCSARLSVYVLFAQAFFPNHAVLVIMFLYVLGVFVALFATLILSLLLKDKNKKVFIMEIPPYRWPTFKIIFKRAFWETKLFIKKAGSFIFFSIIIVWFLAYFPQGVVYASSQSYLGLIGKTISPLFKPLGFSNWVFSVALLFGFIAKEAIIGVLGTVLKIDHNALFYVLPNIITPSAALSFLVFVSLYVPCFATLSVIKKELNSWFLVFFQVLIILLVAFIFSFLTYFFIHI